jgi:hypothetical protein
MTGFKLSSPSEFEFLASLFLVLPFLSLDFLPLVLVVWLLALLLEYYWAFCSDRKWITY